jgi:hypothetical protein
MGGCRLNSGLSPVAGSCEHDNEPSGFVNHMEYSSSVVRLLASFTHTVSAHVSNPLRHLHKFYNNVCVYVWGDDSFI